VANGVARLTPVSAESAPAAAPAAVPGNALGAIAGSTATMDQVVRHAITAVGLRVPDVAAAASTTPARRLGLSAETGALVPGLAADIVLLDGDFRLTTVIQSGTVTPV
jgi:N-acetylglucosamine-6-phosphate deacetylase